MAPERLTTSDYRVFDTILAQLKPGARRTSRAQTTIAHLSGVSERTVRTAYRRLKSWGWLRRQSRPNPGGGRKPDLLDLSHFRTGKKGRRFAGSDYVLDRYSLRESVPAVAGDEETMQRPRRPQRPAINASTQQWMLFLRVYRELKGRPRTAVAPTVEREERRHLKTLAGRLEPEGVSLEDYLREFLTLDDAYLDERDYPLRLAARGDTWVLCLKACHASLEARQRETSPDVGVPIVPTTSTLWTSDQIAAAARAERLKACVCGKAAAGRCLVHLPVSK